MKQATDKLHYMQFGVGGVRKTYSKGTILGVQKGTLIGTRNGKIGRLCGKRRNRFSYYDSFGKRQDTKNIKWISSGFVVKQPFVSQ